MNNGNLLSNLLGATGAGSAAAKSAAPQPRPDNNEKFQQAFDQVRPEIAARKPAARKVPERNIADEHRQHGVKSDSRPEQQISRPLTENKQTAKAQEGRESAVSESDSAAAEKKVASGEHTLVAENTATKEAQVVDIVVAAETPLLPDPGLLLTAGEEILPQAAAFEILPALITATPADMEAGLAESIPSLLLGVEEGEPAEENTNEVELTEENTDKVELASINLNSDELAADLIAETAAPVAISNQLTPVLPEAEVADVGLMNPGGSNTDLKTATPAVQVTQGAAAIGQPVIGKTPEQLLVDDARDFPQSFSANLTSATGDETLDVVNFADNPDFALLNSKAGLNKMVEANFTNMDKVLPAAELAKPAVPASVLEALARPLEPQSPAARAFVVQTGVPATVGSPQWSQAVGDKVLWLAAQNVSAAEIRLDPPELGPMQVKVSITNDQASVTFTSQNPMVRDALDQQLNRLREMFSEQGLNLVNVDVSDKSFAQQEREREEAKKSRAGARTDDEELTPVAITQAVSMRLVDHYA